MDRFNSGIYLSLECRLIQYWQRDQGRAEFPGSKYRINDCAIRPASRGAAGFRRSDKMPIIAYIEDAPDNAELMKFILDDIPGGLQTVIFRDGPDFFSKFQPGRFDLILLDIRLPRMDGFEVFHRLRELDKEVPVIAISAVGQEAVRQNALRVGFAGYQTKPIEDYWKLSQTILRLACRS